MFCTECGQPLRPADKFCARCGTPTALLVASTEPVQPSDKTDERGSEGRPARPAQSTLNVGVQPSSTSGTASFHTGPVGAQLRRSEGQSLEEVNGAHLDAPGSEPSSGPTRVSSVFSYRERPGLPVERADAPESNSRPTLDQPLIVDIPATPDPSHQVTPTNPVIATQSCPACGALNYGVGKFCEICGTKLDSPVAADVEPPRATVPDLGPLPPSAPATNPPIRSAFTDVSPDTANVSYADDVPESQGGSRVFWIIVAALLVLGLGAIAWMLSSRSASSATPATTSGASAITLTPALGSVVAGNGLDMSATLSGTGDPDVTWSVQENGAVGHVVPRGVLSKAGKLSAAAVYVAGSSPGVYHVIATSKADPSQFAVAEITVTAPQ